MRLCHTQVCFFRGEFLPHFLRYSLWQENSVRVNDARKWSSLRTNARLLLHDFVIIRHYKRRVWSQVASFFITQPKVFPVNTNWNVFSSANGRTKNIYLSFKSCFLKSVSKIEEQVWNFSQLCSKCHAVINRSFFQYGVVFVTDKKTSSRHLKR